MQQPGVRRLELRTTLAPTVVVARAYHATKKVCAGNSRANRCDSGNDNGTTRTAATAARRCSDPIARGNARRQRRRGRARPKRKEVEEDEDSEITEQAKDLKKLDQYQ